MKLMPLLFKTRYELIENGTPVVLDADRELVGMCWAACLLKGQDCRMRPVRVPRYKFWL